MNERKPKRHGWIESFSRLREHTATKVGLFFVLSLLLMAILAPWVAPYDPDEQDFSVALSPPTLNHPFGTDQFGRDILSRILYGSRPTLIIVLTATAIGLMVGGSMGLVSGYRGGRVDTFIMRFLDVLLAFPGILLALAIIAGIGPGMKGVIIATSVYSIPQLARVTRGSVLSVKENDYVMAARAIGEKPWNIILRYILPNAAMPILALTFLRMAMIIIIASSLSFLGVGIQPPTAEWGIMLSEGRNYIQIAPYLSILPGIAIILVVLGFNLLGDSLRDALDPKYRSSQ
jgi:peptide/nickel transport system permease protein